MKLLGMNTVEKKETKQGECRNEIMYTVYCIMCSIFKWDCPNFRCDDGPFEICSTEQVQNPLRHILITTRWPVFWLDVGLQLSSWSKIEIMIDD